MFNEDRLLENYFNMIKINSISGNEKDLADYISKKLEGLGLEVKYSYYDESTKSPSIYARLKGKRPGPTILLIGHMDTVAVARGWNTDPFEPVVERDKVYGLGAMDMKGGISAILETTQHLIENKVELSGDVIIAFVSDEEVLSRGTYKLLEDGLEADMAIMAECRFNEAAIGFRGRYSIEVTVYGEAAHASKYPTLGNNALISASKLAIEIEKLPTENHPTLGDGTWCVRHINGGIKNTLSVPDKCDLFVDRYVVPGESFESCKKQIMNLAAELGLEDKVEVRLKPRSTPYMEAFSIPQDHILVKTIGNKYKEVMKEDLPLVYDKSVCDSNFLVAVGDIPTITFGPSGKNMHGANEFGYISQIKAATKIYIEVIKELMK